MDFYIIVLGRDKVLIERASHLARVMSGEGMKLILDLSGSKLRTQTRRADRASAKAIIEMRTDGATVEDYATGASMDFSVYTPMLHYLREVIKGRKDQEEARRRQVNFEPMGELTGCKTGRPNEQD